MNAFVFASCLALLAAGHESVPEPSHRGELSVASRQSVAGEVNSMSEADRRNRERIGLIVEGALFVLFGQMIVMVLPMFLRPGWGPEHGWLGLMLFCFVAAFVLDSRLLEATTLQTPLVTRLLIVLRLAQPVAVVFFAAAAAPWQLSRVVAGLLCVPVVFGLINVAIPGLTWLEEALRLLRLVMNVGTAVMVVCWPVQAARHHRHDSRWPFVGAAAGLSWALLAQSGLFSPVTLAGVDSSYWGLFVFVAFSLAVHASRNQRLLNRLRAVSGEILQAHADERKRVARDLHDSVLQSILAINLKLKMMLSAAGDRPERESLADLTAESSRTVEELRRVAMSLRPAAVENLGLAQAIGWFAREARARGGLEIEVQADVAREPAANAVDHLCRILQEALNNVQKHAAARRVVVKVSTSSQWLTLEIADDGRGFETVQQERAGSGLGLITIRERAQLLGGNVAVASAPGSGTRVCVEVPLS